MTLVITTFTTTNTADLATNSATSTSMIPTTTAVSTTSLLLEGAVGSKEGSPSFNLVVAVVTSAIGGAFITALAAG
ncbi:MAG: hypothetical protein AB8V19_00850 [Candidatus Midichloria sp.]|nr:hypothetical protein MHYMCMPSP_00019 [Hyalomma marginatum]